MEESWEIKHIKPIHCEEVTITTSPYKNILHFRRYGDGSWCELIGSTGSDYWEPAFDDDKKRLEKLYTEEKFKTYLDLKDGN